MTHLVDLAGLRLINVDGFWFLGSVDTTNGRLYKLLVSFLPLVWMRMACG